MINDITLLPGKKAYFASDMHLGLYPLAKSAEREKLIVRWLNDIKPDAGVLFLLGDVFDFWHEYKKVIPRGFTRFLGKLAELADSGIEIHLFTGNHDIWIFDYLPAEIGLKVHYTHEEFFINGKSFFVGHGDDLNPHDLGYRFLKAIFTCKPLQWLFARLHPNTAMAFGQAWSKKSRYSKGIAEKFMGEDKEVQIQFAKKYIITKPINYFIFGHRHIALNFKLNQNSSVINLGEWIQANSYAEFNGTDVVLQFYK
jgi:UDP-2,3-diacylglucosamine hydrolase